MDAVDEIRAQLAADREAAFARAGKMSFEQIVQAMVQRANAGTGESRIMRKVLESLAGGLLAEVVTGCDFDGLALTLSAIEKMGSCPNFNTVTADAMDSISR